MVMLQKSQTSTGHVCKCFQQNPVVHTTTPPKLDREIVKQTNKNMEINHFILDDDKTLTLPYHRNPWKFQQFIMRLPGIGNLSFDLRSYHQIHPKTIHGFAGHFVVYGFCSIVFWWKLKYVLLRWCCWSLSVFTRNMYEYLFFWLYVCSMQLHQKWKTNPNWMNLHCFGIFFLRTA